MNDETMLPPEVQRLEETCAKWSVEFAKRLPEEIRVIAFCGPASFREPEIDDIWHPIVINRGLFRFLICYPPALCRALVGGMRRLILGRFGACREYLQNGIGTIGITPSTICKIENGNVITAYCHPDDAKQMSWIVFDHAKREREGYSVGRVKILRMIFRVMWAWFRMCVRGIGDRNHALASIITLRWLLGMQWIILWMFSLRVEIIVRRTKPRQVFCVHEMWPWSRAVWFVLEQEGVLGVTIQHASITRSKLWSFPSSEELNAGLKIPQSFAVFSEKGKVLLQPFYRNTKFSIGCGPRFSHWKEQQMKDFKNAQPADQILFVSSIPWWDNEVVLQGVRTFLASGTGVRPIVVRLHPLAVVHRRSRWWLHRSQRKGILTVSCASLQDDIARAALVVGMNSTLLEEAAAMGRPAIVLTTDRYLTFGTHLGVHISLSEITRERIEQVIVQMAQRRDTFIVQGREALGLDQPVARIVL